MEGAWIDGIVGRPEHSTAACVQMVHGQIEAAVFDMEIDVGIDDGIITYLYKGLAGVLNSKLLNGRTVIGGVVFGEVAHIAAYFYIKHLGNSEMQVEVTV